MGLFKRIKAKIWPDIPKEEGQRSLEMMKDHEAGHSMGFGHEEVLNKSELEDFKAHLEAVMGSKYRTLVWHSGTQVESPFSEQCCEGGCGTSYTTPFIEAKLKEGCSYCGTDMCGCSHGPKAHGRKPRKVYPMGKGWAVGYERVND